MSTALYFPTFRVSPVCIICRPVYRKVCKDWISAASPNSIGSSLCQKHPFYTAVSFILLELTQ